MGRDTGFFCSSLRVGKKPPLEKKDTYCFCILCGGKLTFNAGLPKNVTEFIYVCRAHR